MLLYLSLCGKQMQWEGRAYYELRVAAVEQVKEKFDLHFLKSSETPNSN